MKIKLALIFLSAASLSFANTIEKIPLSSSNPPDFSYRYVGLGIGPIVYPFANAYVGMRAQKYYTGFDFGAGIATIGFVNFVRGYANVLFFPSPSSEGQFYTGLGAFAGPVFYPETPHIFGAGGLDLIFGHDFISKKGARNFLQVDISYPSYILGAIIYEIPLFTFSYGWAF